MEGEFVLKAINVRVYAPVSLSDEAGSRIADRLGGIDGLAYHLHGAALEYVARVTTPEEQLRVEVTE